MKQGHDKSSAYAICQASINKTKKGVVVEKVELQNGQVATINDADGNEYVIKSDGIYVMKGKKPKLGSGERFKKLEKELEDKGVKAEDSKKSKGSLLEFGGPERERLAPNGEGRVPSMTELDKQAKDYEKIRDDWNAGGTTNTEGTTKDAGALAAWIGRKKYGKEKYQKMAAEGKKKKDSKKAVVLKSLRTNGGAADWLRFMSKHYPDAVIVDNDTLKSYGDVEWQEPVGPMSTPHHVVIEQDMTPVIETIQEGDITSVIKAFVSKGFMDFDEFGPRLTDKWHDAINGFVKDAVADALKSVNSAEDFEFYPENVSSLGGEVFDALANILKSLDDAERLANMSDAPENATTGHALRPNKPISDAEVKHDEQVNADSHVPEADTEDKMAMPEGISEDEVNTQVHAHDHNAGKEVRGQPGNDISGHDVSVGSKGSTSMKAVMTPSDAQGTNAPESVDDHAARHAKEARWSQKATTDEEGVARPDTQPFDADPDAAKVQARIKQSGDKAKKSVDDFENTVFKSLGEARHWESKLSADQREAWHVVPTSFHDKKEFGRRYTYIVKSRDPRPKVGAFGNKPVK